jgi:2-polyprenyl-3-methyl-5-hydroxy-6-metoxy-1,4-benzoquinol methylase
MNGINKLVIYKVNTNITGTSPLQCQTNGGSIFDEEVTIAIKDRKVLDIGCVHGEFTIQCSLAAKEVVGFDANDHFVQNWKKKLKA